VTRSQARYHDGRQEGPQSRHLFLIRSVPSLDVWNGSKPQAVLGKCVDPVLQVNASNHDAVVYPPEPTSSFQDRRSQSMPSSLNEYDGAPV
jgi:hypothetical protein